ncbi:ribosome biogenesis GTPase YqeH [Gracilibacillus thailandensis]|uniref:Ribosome biogenesis GTPase YqeH n=1 Tax=Gracilibacillus thailandensis TaxID=563735 RepID=A0A6N7QW39_9BACI|nr:ribosome biogenesis GTPase YqeH [Gracilibacillus thailandensis]MRI66327.1 ribosome biogenesis GTPase YqeH [Gracilibacillus thailandensis]
MEKIFCEGCGAEIQTEDKSKSGYVPKSALENEQIICQRCFRLKHYNEVQDVEYTDDDYLRMINQISDTNSLVVKIVDIFDFNGSFITGLQRLTGNNPIILIGNKVDLLPKSTNKNKLIQWMKKTASDYGLKVQDVFLVSAAKGQGFDKVEEEIEARRNEKDVYVVGCTNVGKSTFINQLIKRSSGIKDAITTSYFPGTTLGFIQIPLDRKSNMYDTPGVVNRRQLVHYVTDKDLKVITPKKEIKPKIYQLQDKQTLFFGGFARFDFEKGLKQSFVCYFSNQLMIHRTKLEHADDFYDKHVGDLLEPPSPETLEQLPPLEKQSVKIPKDKTDIVIPGLGWITVPEGGITVSVHVPKGVQISLRPALI